MFGRKVIVVEGESKYGGGSTDVVQNSGSRESDSECDSDVSTPSGDNDIGLSQTHLKHGSYDFVYSEEGIESDDAAGVDTDGEFGSDEECVSLSGSNSGSGNNIGENAVTYCSDDVINLEPDCSSTNEVQEGGEDNSCILLSVVRGDSPIQNYEDVPGKYSELSPHSNLVTENTKFRTSSYQRACSHDSTFSETSGNEHFSEDFLESDGDNGSLEYREQLDSVEEASGISEENDPHGLIRKPAVRRRGFAWVSKSLPRTSRAARMKQLQRKHNVDSSLDLGPSLLILYDNRIASGAGDGNDDDNDENDDMVIDGRGASKTNSLPARADKYTVDGDHYREDIVSPHMLSTDHHVIVENDEPTVPKARTTLEDAKKRPLSNSSVSSNSFTYSPRQRKKRANGVTGDNNGGFLEDTHNSIRTVVSDSKSKVSISESIISVDNDFVQKIQDGDRQSDNMSITSSETDSFGNDAESNIAIDCSRMSSSPPDAISISQSNKPLSRPNKKYSYNDPYSKDYSNNSTHIPVVPDHQSKLPYSGSEMGHESPDSQSPIRQASTEVDTARKSDISRLSSSSFSRQEARMKFFTNYEEYMSQSSVPQVSNAEENPHICSESQPSTSSKGSPHLPLSAPSFAKGTSGLETEIKNIGQSHLNSSAHANTTSSEGGRDNFPKIARRSERTSRRSDRRNSNSKHEGFSTSSRSGFSRSSKKRDLTASSDAGNRSSQGYTSYVSRVVTEIIESERTYIASLEDIIHGYLEPMETILTTNEAKKDIECLFSNIRDIYKFGCTFLADLEISSADCVKVAQCFVKHNKGFVIYTDYCTNYPRAVEVLTRFMQHPELSELCKERQLALGHGLPLGAYLLKPVQRILKYHLLLQNIVKNSEKEKEEAEILEQAFHHMTEMAHHINEMKRKHEHAVRIQEIQSQLEDYVGEDLTRLGELVLEGTFKVYGAKASRQVFLFERGLLICKKNEGGMLSCKAFVLCSNLMLVEVIPNEPLSFHIIPFNNPRAQYTLQARNMEQKRLWCQNIKELILESFKGRIPDNVKNLIMQLGREHDDDYVSKEAMEAGRKNQHTAPEYLEKRKLRGKSGSRIPDFSILRPQKAKRGGNKKADFRPGQKSPETSRRAKSRSPEGHRQLLSRQNAAKARSLSSNSPTMPVAAFCKSIPISVQAITQADTTTSDHSSVVPECTSPDSPVYRKSRKFTYFKNNDEKTTALEKTTDISKRPLSFLMARANPILSADLTQLLARCGGSIKMQGPVLPDSEENDKIHPSHTVIDDFSEPSSNNTSDMKNDSVNEQHYAAEEEMWVEDSKHNDTAASLTGRDNATPDNSSEITTPLLENAAIVLSSLNKKRSRDTDSKSTNSLALKKFQMDTDKSCECEEEHQTSIEESNVLESAENIYENVHISKDYTRDGHNDDQSFRKNEGTEDNSGPKKETLDAEKTVLMNRDICSKAAAENELKKKSLRLPNTSKHLLTHDYGLTDGVKAKLTNWNSVEKLTEGSMSDLSHLNDDPWVLNSGITSSMVSMDAEPSKPSSLSIQTSSRPRGHSDVSEMMQISNNKENMDWLVYLNRNSPTSLKHQSPDEIRNSTSILDKYSTVQQNLEAKNKPSSPISYATPPREYMTFENMKRLGLIKDSNRDESANQNKYGRNSSSSSSRKVNAFGMSPTTITTVKPARFTSAGLFRSNSTPISEIEDYRVTKVAFKERPVSLDIDNLTTKNNRIAVEIKKYMSNSSENLKDANQFPTNLPTIKVEDEEADSNRLSVISSISTSSYESQSSSSSDGLVGTLKSKLHAWEKTSKNRPESEISCASTLTSDDDDDDDDDRDVLPKSGNTFEPPSKNRSTWKEDRQLETVLREHSLGSSKLGSRIAQPAEQVIAHNLSDSSDHESHSQSFCDVTALIRTSEQSDELSSDKTNISAQFKSSLTTTTEVPETLVQPTLKNCNIPQSAPGFSNLNNESNRKGFVQPRQEIALELSEESSKRGISQENPQIVKTKTMKESSNLERRESSESLESTDSCYERRLSAAFDSDTFQEMSETDKHNDRSLKEALLLKKSIRDYVKDIEEKFKAQSLKTVEVKRREPGVMIRQRLQTLRESALHGWRNLSTSSSKSPHEERPAQLSHYDRRTLIVMKDNSLDSNSKSVCLRPSSSRDSLSKSVDNLAKSRDNVFMSRSRDSLTSMSRSRDSLNSLSESPGCRHSAPIFSLKTNNAGHEKDANRFHYRTPEEGQTILGNQFIHRRTHSSSQSSLLESQMQSSLDKEVGPMQSSKLMHQQNENSAETENLVVMKGWVRSLISKFQVNS